MPLFDIATAGGTLISQGLDEHAPAIRLDQGKPDAGHKKPLHLPVGESTQVTYPMLGRELACIITRTE